MAYLTPSEIGNLYTDIHSRIAAFPVMPRPKASAIFHILTSFETFLDSAGGITDLPHRGSAYQTAYDGLNYALRWICENCPDVPCRIELDETVLKESDDVLMESGTYSLFATQLMLLLIGKNRAERSENGVVIVSADEIGNRELEAARFLFEDAERPVDYRDTQSLSIETVHLIRRKVKILRGVANDIRYTFDQKLFNAVRTERSHRNLVRKTMNPSWNLGSYTYGEFASFWGAVDALNEIHTITTRRIADDARQTANRVRILSKQGWIDRISKWSRLRKTTVTAILCDLTYSEGLHLDPSRNKKAHAMFQPFFDLGDDRIALSSSIVRIANFERNMWLLLSLLRPRLYFDLGNLKEDYWIDSFLKKQDLQKVVCCPRIKYTYKKIKRDLDLLIVDREDQFALVCELKWLTRSPSPYTVVDNDKDLRKGIRQSEAALEWIKTDYKRISQLTGIPVNELENFEFRPLVISKETLPSGHFGSQSAPVIDERLFDWIVSKPHKKSLREFWRAVESQAYLPTPGVFVEHGDAQIKWGDLKFVLKDVVFRIRKRWLPEYMNL